MLEATKAPDGPSTETGNQDTYISSLSGLRGIAALIVLVSHFSNRSGFLGNMLGTGGGQLGVMLFFLLSAYLMMHIYHDENNSPARFLWNRFARVYPLFFAAILVSFGLGYVAPWLNFFGIRAGEILPHLYFQKARSLLWTIGPEILFYAVFAGLLLASRKAREATILTVALASMVFWTQIDGANWMNAVEFSGNLAKRHYVYKFFVIGLLLFLAIRHLPELKGKASAAVAVLVGAAVVLAYPMIYKSVFGLPADRMGWDEPYTAMVLAAFLASSLKVEAMKKVLGSRPLVWVGDVSFALYLFHLLPLTVMKHVGLLQPAFWSLALAVASSLALAWAIHVGYEKPVRQWLRALPGKRIVRRVA